ncbi:7473_t:CDS:2 [Funneliformis geosporum]|uniref:7473_t:CDS:1 n=1 Tax=Funneliformis geosporum TaxID=1117311 RepID=A0A9W4WYB2_9GLOM|nr:7473_t:CDS:2 [Funneliformis geosporum]
MINSDEFDHPCPSIVKMWVLLEGSPRARKLNADISKAYDLDDFVYILQEEYEELRAVRPQNIVILNNNNTQLPPDTDLQTLTKTTTAKNPLVARYPISDVNIKVTFMYGQRQGKREIPHTSGSFDRLEALAREIFKDLEEGIIYFVNDGTEIWNAYNFNTLVKSQTAQDKSVVLKLKVMIKGKKKYSDWKLKDVFKDILKKPTYNSLSDMPELDMTELPPLDPPFNQNQLTNFVTEIKVKLSSLRNEFGNETKNRLYIDAFMTHAVDYIRTQINKSVRLDVEQGLDGSHGYGPVDYWVKLVEVLLFLCEAKAEDMNQGSAQAIVQSQSGIERLNKLGYEELLIYGIASTGKLWRFIR